MDHRSGKKGGEKALSFQVALEQRKATDLVAFKKKLYERSLHDEGKDDLKTKELASEIFTLLVESVSINCVFNVICSMLDCHDFDIGQDLSRLYYEHQGNPLIGGNHYDDGIRLVEESMGRLLTTNLIVSLIFSLASRIERV